MPLSTTDIRVFKSANISDVSTNGGVMTTNELTDVVGALFTNVDNNERVAGSTKWRKMFFKLHNDGAGTLLGTRLYLDKDTDGDDTMMFAAGTMTDSQGDLSSPKLYGSFALKTSVLAGATEVKYTLPTGVTNTFDIGDTMRVTNKATYSGTGNEEFVAVTNVGITGSEVTLTIAPALVNNYTNSSTRLMGVFSVGDVAAQITNVVINSAGGGTLDTAKVTCNNRSTIAATWTITFTSSTTFDVSSNMTGAVTSGNTFSAYNPNNASYSLPYFSVASGALSGFTTGDSVTFTSNPAAVPIWLKRVVPAGSNPIAVNRATFIVDGGTV